MKRALPLIGCLAILLLSFVNLRQPPKTVQAEAPVAAAVNLNDLQKVLTRLDQIELFVKDYQSQVEASLIDTTPPAAAETGFMSYTDLKWTVLQGNEQPLGFMFLHDGTGEKRALIDQTVKQWESDGMFNDYPWAISGTDDYTTNREHGWRAGMKPTPIVVMIKKDAEAVCTYGPCSLQLPATADEFRAWRIQTCKTAVNRPSGTREQREQFAALQDDTESTKAFTEPQPAQDQSEPAEQQYYYQPAQAAACFNGQRTTTYGRRRTWRRWRW